MVKASFCCSVIRSADDGDPNSRGGMAGLDPSFLNTIPFISGRAFHICDLYCHFHFGSLLLYIASIHQDPKLS